jgi:hypothetical protein
MLTTRYANCPKLSGGLLLGHQLRFVHAFCVGLIPQMRSQRLQTRIEINRTFPHQIILPLSECLGQKAKLHRLYLTNNNLSATSRSAIIKSTEHVIYCFKERGDAYRFCHHFGGRKLAQREMAGQLWFRFDDK